MSRDAVKFGRMSKRQREKVEDEANFHRQSSVGSQVESCALSPILYNNNNNNIDFDKFEATTPGYPQFQYSPNGTMYTQVPIPTGYAPLSPELPYKQENNSPLIIKPMNKPSDEVDLGLLTKAVAEAHERTRLYGTEELESLKHNPPPLQQIDIIRCMNHEKLWMEVAEKVTLVVQQIIEFAKMVPGFMNLLQDDQIMLLKGGCFEIALIRLCRAFDADKNAVVFGGAYIPIDAFRSLNDEERNLMCMIFAFARDLHSLYLTDNELALYAAVALMDPDRPGIKDASIIQKLGERMEAALHSELSLNHTTDVEHIRTLLLDRISVLHVLADKHSRLLHIFQHNHPTLEFPALHKELFSQDSSNGSATDDEGGN